MESLSRPLEGVKVLELATFVAAPCCCRYLRDLGADVIKVETARGDNLRYVGMNEGRPFGDNEDTTFTQENTGKRATIINIKTPEGMEAFMKLIDWCDIFVTNNRPASLKRSGLDYETLSQRKPELVMGLVCGYGEKGPQKDLPGYDHTSFFARSGVMGTMYDRDSIPMLPCSGFGDHQVGMYLASGLIAALYRAKNTGQGDQVTVSLLQAGVFDVSIYMTASQYGEPTRQYPVSRSEIANPMELPYRTKDNRWLAVTVPPYDQLFGRFAEAIGRPELAEDERFYPQANALNNLPELQQIICDAIATKDVDEWEKVFAEYDLPASKCYIWSELLEDPQCWENEYLTKVTYPSGEERINVRTPVTFARTAPAEMTRAPFLGEHTRQVLAELGYSEAQIDAMIEAGQAGDVTRIG